MAAWKDERKATEALSGNVNSPQTNYRTYVVAGFGVAIAVAAAVVVLRHKPVGLTVASQEAVAPPAAPTAVEKSVCPETAKADVIVLPPVVLGEKCPEGELEQVRGGAESRGAATSSLEEARRIEESASGDLAALEKARRLYQEALDAGRLGEKDEGMCLARLAELTNKLVLDPKVACVAPPAILHKVEPGEGVEKIARRYKVNQGQIKRLNKLNDKLMVRYGQTLKILPGDVVFRISRARLNGTLYIDGVFVRRYPVGLGPGAATPLGVYAVERKVVNPDWYCEGKRIPFGDPANILGTRWMALTATDGTSRGDGLGIHGTAKPQTVPGRESKGCVRMVNSDVEELYDLMPQKGNVEIVD